MIHRDLKPDNIMVGDFGEVLVMDWGIAKVREQKSEDGGQGAESRGQEAEGRDQKAGDGKRIERRQDESADSPEALRNAPTVPGDSPTVRSIRSDTGIAATMEGAVQGTPAYMPPEQAEGKIDEIDHRSDIYSLGAILYEILTLKRPVTGKTIHDVLLKVADGKILAPEKRAPKRNIPKELSAIVMKAMAHSRRRRYQSVRELQQDINLYLEGRSVSAKEDSALEAVSKLIKRNKGIAAAIGIASLIVIAVVGVAFRNVSAERDVARSAERKARAAVVQQRRDALAASKRFALQAIQAAKMERWIDAERRLEDSATVATDSPWALYAGGMLAELKSDFQKAEQSYEAALKLNSKLTVVKMALGQLKARSGEVDAARKLLAGIERIKDWKSLLRAGKVLYQAGRRSDSTRAYEKGLALMAEADDAERELKAEEIKDLVDDARFSMEDAKAREACAGFVETVRHLELSQQATAVSRKLAEINAAEYCLSRPYWQHTDETKKFLHVGFHHCQNLRFLHPLSGLPIRKLRLTACPGLTRIQALAGLPLMALDLGGGRVSDLSPLRGMPLEELELMDNPVTDLSPVRDMRLTRLGLSFGTITDLSPLAGMKSLLTLSLYQARRLRELSPLRGLELRELILSQTEVEDLSPLAGMPLKKLSFSETKVRDISVLKGLPLEHLELNEGLTDLSVLEGMKLKSLYVHSSPSFRLELLEGMPIERLSCGRCELSDLSALRGRPLKAFSASGNKFTDLSPLEGAPLEELFLGYSEVTDLSPLKNSKLVRADLNYSKIVDISPLGGLKNLNQLDVHRTPVRSLSGFENHPELHHLGIPHTQVSDLTPLKNLKNLAHLDFSGTKVSSVEPLSGLSLSTCDMAHVQVTDLTPLANMKHLGRLTLSEDQQLNEESKALVEKLKARGFNVRIEKARTE